MSMWIECAKKNATFKSFICGQDKLVWFIVIKTNHRVDMRGDTFFLESEEYSFYQLSTQQYMQPCSNLKR